MISALPFSLTEHPTSLKGLSVLDRYQAHGKEYILLKGVASLAAGDFVVYDEDGVTERTDADSVGAVAVAMSAAVAGEYGWFQIFGKCTTANVTTGSADDAVLYLTSTAGRVDDAIVDGDRIYGALGRSLAASNVGTVQLNYPFVSGALNVLT